MAEKYALAVPINLGLGFDFWRLPHWASVVRESDNSLQL